MCDQTNEGGYNDQSVSDESEPMERPNNVSFVLELDSEEEEDNDIEFCDPTHGHRAQSSFSLRGGGSAFSNRCHGIFDCLESVAQLSSSLKQENITDRLFAQPLLPTPCRKTSQALSSCPTPATRKGAPDYVVHPERWTYYSLEDVTEITDQGNSKAAHHFLFCLQQRKVHQEIQSESLFNIRQKVIFSRPSKLLKEQPADQLSAVRSNEKETYLTHLEDEGEEGGEKLKAGGRRTEQTADQCTEKEEKQVQKEKGEVEMIEDARPGFTSFRNVKHKNYRKRTEGEDK